VKRKHKVGTFAEFKEFTTAVASGERRVDPKEPKIWYEPVGGSQRVGGEVQFSSLEAGAKLLSTRNRDLLRVIATHHPKSVSELAALVGRAEQNVLRTLHKMSAVGLVRLNKGAGRAYQPEVAARKVHFEIVP
jgi:predicted transcriptional regulator